jgi:hypothetical protein
MALGSRLFAFRYWLFALRFSLFLRCRNGLLKAACERRLANSEERSSRHSRSFLHSWVRHIFAFVIDLPSILWRHD